MAQNDFLQTLNLTPEEVLALSGRDRSRLLNFLLRWEHFDALHACLDALIAERPKLVSLLDLRARAYMAQGQAEKALPVMQQRLGMRESMTAHILEAQLTLAKGEPYAARSLAQKLVDANPERVTAWAALAEIQLAMGALDDAFASYRRLQELSPHSRAYLLGMMGLYQARADWVTASGYATRLLRIAEEEGALPIETLRSLRDYFAASGETTRVADLDAEFAHRRAEELAEMRERFAPRAPATEAPAVEVAPAAPAPAAAPPVAEHIPVSEEERARIAEAVRSLFGFGALHPGQLETIACALRDEDVLTILPTGGGKSLCYQLPALLDERGSTLVVSPLIALMKDQVESLPEAARERATTLHSNLDAAEMRRRTAQIAAGAYKLVYAAPERLRQPPFLHLLRQAGIARLVVDEAHCVSVWGHDFRPDYLIIKRAREALGSPPLIAVTATAPPRVRRDILQQLGDMPVVAGDSTRPNLHYQVFHARNSDEKLARLIAFCKATPGSGIVYAGTRRRCERLAAMLRQHGVDSTHYHAGIPDRAAVQDAFMSGRVRVVVATIAFGMGIDKPDVRFIVHFVPPSSLESYYQEAGRAGRDGEPSRCLLMYSSSDRGTLTRHAREGVLPVETLRAVYAGVQRQLDGRALDGVNAEMLTHALSLDDITFRVALSMLEETGLLYRGPDLPRHVHVTQEPAPPGEPPPDFAAFAQAMGLAPGAPARIALADAVERTALTLDTFEGALLRWAEAGWITYQAERRDMALELLPPPADAAERVATLLERYETIQGQRVDEISAYAETGRCRHGYLNAYLGGAPVVSCTACDNCVQSPPLPDPGLPGEREQLMTILRVLDRQSWGRASLTAILIGDEEKAPDTGLRSKDFGALSYRSRAAIGALIKRLEEANYVQGETLHHGGVALGLTPKGHTVMQAPHVLERLARKPRPPKRAPRRRTAPASHTAPQQHTLDGKAVPATAPPVDEELRETIRAWRNALAREQKIPAYVVFANKVLDAIAAQQPTSLATLGQIKGVGPRTLEKYGEAVVELVREHKRRE